MRAFFVVFNPFKALEQQDNLGMLRNLIIITAPIALFNYFKTFLGIQSWISNFDVRSTEKYYRISCTYQIYAFIYKVIMLILIKCRLEYAIIYSTDFFIQCFIFLRSTRYYIAEIKLEQIEQTRHLGRVQEIKESYTSFSSRRSKTVEGLRISNTLLRINPSRPIEFEDDTAERTRKRESGYFYKQSTELRAITEERDDDQRCI